MGLWYDECGMKMRLATFCLKMDVALFIQIEGCWAKDKGWGEESCKAEIDGDGEEEAGWNVSYSMWQIRILFHEWPCQATRTLLSCRRYRQGKFRKKEQSLIVSWKGFCIMFLILTNVVCFRLQLTPMELHSFYNTHSDEQSRYNSIQFWLNAL